MQLSRTIKSKTKKINYSYDKNGNLVKQSEKTSAICTEERTFTYNNENRLTAVKDNGRLMMAALYGGDGERIFTVNYMHQTAYRSNGGGTLVQRNIPSCETDRNVGYDAQLIVDELLVPNGVKPISYGLYELTGYVNDTNREHTQVLMEYGANGRNSVSGMKGKYFYDYDGRGSVVGLNRNDSGLFDVFYSYDDSGVATRRGAGSMSNPYTYNGEYTDLSVGMQYLRAREYNPSTGSFTSRDTYLGTANVPLSRNGYTYAHNNPVNYQDPSGHFWHIIAAAVGGAIVGGIVGAVGAATSGQSIWKGAVSGAAGGAVSGAVFAATGSSALAGAAGGAVSGGLGVALNGGSGKDILRGALVGAAGGLVGGAVGGKVFSALGNNLGSALVSGIAGGVTGGATSRLYAALYDGKGLGRGLVEAFDPRAMTLDAFLGGLGGGLGYGYNRILANSNVYKQLVAKQKACTTDKMVKQSTPDDVPQITKNQIKGEIFDQVVGKALSDNGDTAISKQITIEVADGTRTE
ncbi:MAG: RHS repeat-associated core domain-containing protein [Oscillospiraceae bacterium]|nr:RHS repeat-associated core domain-containing protein [Oscillospiraceae bacterium]